MTRQDGSVRCVGAVVFDPDGRMLLVRRANEPGRGLWSLPGGRVEPGETDVAALVREVLEETGLTVTVGRLVGRVRIGTYDVGDYVCTVVGGVLAAATDALDVGYLDPRIRAHDPGTRDDARRVGRARRARSGRWPHVSTEALRGRVEPGYVRPPDSFVQEGTMAGVRQSSGIPSTESPSHRVPAPTSPPLTLTKPIAPPEQQAGSHPSGVRPWSEQTLATRILMVPLLPFVALWLGAKAVGRWLDRAFSALGHALLKVLAPVVRALRRGLALLWRGLGLLRRGIVRVAVALWGALVAACVLVARPIAALARALAPALRAVGRALTAVGRVLVAPVRASIRACGVAARAVGRGFAIVGRQVARPIVAACRACVPLLRAAGRGIVAATRAVGRQIAAAGRACLPLLRAIGRGLAVIGRGIAVVAKAVARPVAAAGRAVAAAGRAVAAAARSVLAPVAAAGRAIAAPFRSR